jgi:choline-sulfatase
MDWVPTTDEEGRFVRGGHARSYVPPNVGVAPWTKFLSYDEETHFRALEYLRERGRTGADEPFFLVASYHHPHDPFLVTQELWDLYEGDPIDVPVRPEGLERTYSAMDHWANEAHGTDEVDLDDADAMRALRRAYYGLVTFVDRKLGELVAALEQTGQARDTIVIFTSDHGDMLGERRMVQTCSASRTAATRGGAWARPSRCSTFCRRCSTSRGSRRRSASRSTAPRS